MKKYLLTGLAILMPVVLTGIIIVFLFNFFTSPFVNFVEKIFTVIEENSAFILPEKLTLLISRLLMILFLLAFIFTLGVVAHWFLIKNVIAATNNLISRIPIVKSVYKVSREIISALFSIDGKKAFHYPVLIPFPNDPLFCVGFCTGQVAEECQEKVDKPLISVFAPTAPHPISGFLFLCPKDEIDQLDMTNEEAVKFLVSCGLIYKTSEQIVKTDELF